MTLVDAGLGELPVHMPSCRFVGEPVTGTACHPFYALLDRWEQHGVVQALDNKQSHAIGLLLMCEQRRAVGRAGPGANVTRLVSVLPGVPPRMPGSQSTGPASR
jgi:hypothetical protein